MNAWRPGLYALISTILSVWTPTAAGDLLHDRFRDEALRSWRELRAFTLELQGTVTDASDPILGYPESTRERMKSTFKGFQDHLLLRWEQQLGQIKREIIWGINSEYAFRIERPHATGPWTIGYLNGQKDPVRTKIEVFGSPLFVSHSVDGQDLGWTASQPGFKVNSVSPSTRDGRKLVMLDFSSSVSKREDYQIRRGRVLLDPARHWAVLDYELQVQLDAPATSAGRIEYADDVAGMPIPRSYVQDFKATIPGEGLYHRRRTCELHLTRGGVSDSEFRLSAYGLKEPATHTSRETPIWILPIVLGMGCLAVSLILRYLAHGGRSATSQSP